MNSGLSAGERYEHGLVLRKAGLFKQAVEEFEQAAADRSYALKAYAHIGLSHKSSGHYEQAVAAFRKALTFSPASRKELVQILYVLGRTLDILGRASETVEVYRWIRREAPDYRDVEQRLQALTARRPAGRTESPRQSSRIVDLFRSCHVLLRAVK